ncbi:hypothetical protein BSKO_01839 [Bryopsis sp. KO-2023]|nr:hypothetical protein BSKO_01839 [Bryopsis sp. KO-2023]
MIKLGLVFRLLQSWGVILRLLDSAIQMDDASRCFDRLESFYLKLKKDLDFIEKRLEDDATKRTLETGVDIQQLVARIRALGSKVASLEERQLNVESAKTELMDLFKNRQEGTFYNLENVRVKVGLPANGPLTESCRVLNEAKEEAKAFDASLAADDPNADPKDVIMS